MANCHQDLVYLGKATCDRVCATVMYACSCSDSHVHTTCVLTQNVHVCGILYYVLYN